jgi:heterodisulfide reductase subunit A
MNKKIGIYICHCGGNISDFVDVDKVRAALEHEDGVVLAKTTQFACADANQKEMESDIREYGLDGVIVASCSPKLHLSTFRAVTERAGLNKYNYVHANIREQVSWAHSDKPPGTTDNAIHVVKAALARVRYAESLKPIRINAVKAIAVIGSGIAGMRAAIELAEMGSEVYLIEREHFTGGHTAKWEELFSSGESGKDLTARLYDELRKQSNITLFTGAEVTEQTGSIGNFTLHVRITPTYVKENATAEEVQQAMEACPLTVPDPYDFGLTTRKAIFRNRPGEFPDKAVVDMNHCNQCGACEKVNQAVDFSQQVHNLSIQVGAVVFATGFDPYTPKNEEFGYGSLQNVITLPQFKQLIALNNDRLVYMGKEVRTVAYIYCVGSRQPEGDNKYCSRFCCTAAIHTASMARNKYRNIRNYHFTRGVRTYGKQEAYYSEALNAGDVFLQSSDNELPEVSQKGSKTVVKIKDILTEQREMELATDLVVLVTSMVPREDQTTPLLFKIPRGRDNFLKEIHLKLRPVETVIDGITIAGTCQGPMNICESIGSSLSASVKAFSIVSKGEIALEPIIAKVNQHACTWCDACLDACPFDAVTKVNGDSRSVAAISESVCKGCGMCLPVCPYDAIELVTYSNREIEEMIDMLAMD